MLVLISLLQSALLLTVQADGRTFGTLVGTAGGFVVANNVHGVSPWIAAPVGALAGNYLGSLYQNGHRSYSDYYNNNDSYYYANRYDEGHYLDNYYAGRLRSGSTRSASGHRHKPASKKRAPPVVDLHPGIELIKVPILNSNGLQTEISILRIKDKFIGPQGEEYSSLPTAEALAKAYGM